MNPVISIGIFAYNEEDSIKITLDSLFKQTLFKYLSYQSQFCEIICIVNGSTDKTYSLAFEALEYQQKYHQFAEGFKACARNIEEKGKCNAWNKYIHQFSSRESGFIFCMDADILFKNENTLWNMYASLKEDPVAAIAVDRPIKDIALKKKKTLMEKISLATSQMTQSASGQVTGQLYCIRANMARQIFMPRGLLVEDGFLKQIIVTDCFTHLENSARICNVSNAAHIFQAYMSIRDILNNQKRQMMGQTVLYVLFGVIKRFSLTERKNLAHTLSNKEDRNPHWLKDEVKQHVDGIKNFGQLFPGVLSFRFKRWLKVPGVTKKMICFPAVLAGFFVTMIASVRAYREIKRGDFFYWPDTKSVNMEELTQCE